MDDETAKVLALDGDALEDALRYVNNTGKEDAALRRLCLCAPEALRLLVGAEWEGVAGSNCGPVCGRCHQPKWNGHAPDCRWLALMKKAGLRE